MPERVKLKPLFPDTVRRLNHLIDALSLTSYLEIGLGNGGTFDNVKASQKTGVDPHPWDAAAGKLEGVHLATSDEYFSRNWNSGAQFDLILLDGLHTAEQTYRDFVNSLHFAHAETIWLIDDVMPNDVFSAIPDQGEAMKLRKAATGSDDAAWHGDVYKLVWMLGAFHPNATLRTFNAGQPQSLVYHARKNAAANGMRLSDIAGLRYIDTLARRTDYRLGAEGDILSECVSEISKCTSLRRNESQSTFKH